LSPIFGHKRKISSKYFITDAERYATPQPYLTATGHGSSSTTRTVNKVNKIKERVKLKYTKTRCAAG